MTEMRLKIKPAVKLIEEFAGSVEIPERFQGLSESEIVQKAKQEYFQKE